MAEGGSKQSERLKQVQLTIIAMLFALAIQWLIQGLQALSPLAQGWQDIAFAVYLGAIALVLWLIWGRRW